MKNISRRNISGFTLVEILVVVLIIGILSAVAIPMYQGAVDKSRFSTLLPAAKSIKDAQEAMRMSTGLYTDKMEDLDISMENGELNFTFDIHNSLADPSLVRTTSPKLENVRLASYFDFNPMMAGQKHCEAKAGDERANRLCGPLLQGQELGTTADGYNRYLLDEDIDKPTCDGANRSWSSSQGKCYKDTASRCENLGMPAISGEDQCGYVGGVNEYKVINAEGICDGSSWDFCRYATVNDGGVCIAKGRAACHHSTINAGGTCLAIGGSNEGGAAAANGIEACKGAILNGGKCIGDSVGSLACDLVIINQGGVCEGFSSAACQQATINSGGVCESKGKNTCNKVTVNTGGKCVANFENTCTGTYNGGCCEGEFCPSHAPKC